MTDFIQVGRNQWVRYSQIQRVMQGNDILRFYLIDGSSFDVSNKDRIEGEFYKKEQP